MLALHQALFFGNFTQVALTRKYGTPSKRNKESKCSHWHIVASILWIAFLGILYKWLAQLSHVHQHELPEKHTSAPLSLTPGLLQSHLREMLKHRSQNGTIVLVGFTEGCKDMLLNMICRWKELGVKNYAIVVERVGLSCFCKARNNKERNKQRRKKSTGRFVDGHVLACFFFPPSLVTLIQANEKVALDAHTHDRYDTQHKR